MTWISLESLSPLALVFLLLAALFGVIELCWPGRRDQRRFRKGWLTDACYFLFTPLVTHNLGRLLVAVTVALLLWVLGQPLDSEVWKRSWGVAAGLSPIVQVVLALVLGDFIGYWTHRLLHKRLWPIHAIHHSSEEMDWMSTLRLHPLNDFLGRLVKTVPFILVGFSPFILAALLPFLALHAFLLHANVDWSFGPLRYAIASPVFHRWHHSSHAESRGKNFAGLFPIWDLLFGTYHMPTNRRPRLFGAPDAHVPDAFWKQVFYPWRQTRNQAGANIP